MEKPYAIVLGAAVWPGGAPSPTLIRRAATAAALWHAGAVGGIVATGGVGRHPPSEAELIRLLLAERGVPERAVLIEDRSHTTLENLANARALLPPGARAIICGTCPAPGWSPIGSVCRPAARRRRSAAPTPDGSCGPRCARPRPASGI